MKIKLVILFIICVFFSFIIDKQNELIIVPKDERKLIKVHEKIFSGKVTKVNDGDSFVLNDNIQVRLFGIDAPELLQTCTVRHDDSDASTTNNLITQNNQQNSNIKGNIVQNTIQSNLQTNDQIISSQQRDNDVNVPLEDIVKCGEDAKEKLIRFIGNNKLDCYVKGKDAYDRMVCECSFNAYNNKTKRKYKVNINKEMVLSGYAVAFQQISDKYVEDENKAREDGNGIWSLNFEIPSIYRSKNKNK